MDRPQFTAPRRAGRSAEAIASDRPQSLVVLPYDEIPMWKWNGNPYSLDGGNGGRSEDDGAYFLLPYWMGRYHRLFE